MIKFILIILIIVAFGVGGWYMVNNSITIPKPEASKKVYKIGIIQTASNMDSAYKGFKEELEKLGYKHGENITLIHNNVNSDAAKAKEVATSYINENVDIIITFGVLPTKAAQSVTTGTNIPVVFSIVANPVGNKFINSHQKPGGNLTGIDSSIAEISTKRLSLFKEIAPKISKVLFFYNNPTAVALDDMRKTAKSLNIQLVEKEVEDVADLDKQMAILKTGEFDAIFRTGDSIISPRTDQIIALALKHKVPYSGTNNSDSEKGGLMSYGTDFTTFGEQAASFVDRILKGQKPQDIPVEQPKTTELYINLKTAEQIGITIPNEVLRKANKIISK